jgi:PAS domain S-box-containing protein
VSGLPDAAYRKLFEALPDGAFVVDLASGRLEWLNDAAARLHGSTREALLGMVARTLVVDPDETAYREGHATIELRRLDDGRAFPAETSARVVEWEGRQLLVGIVRDGTARAQMQRELQDSRALLASAFHSSPLLMGVTDAASGEYLEVNDTFCRVIGFTREELLGRRGVDLGIIEPAQRQRLVDAVQRDGRARNLELPIITRTGQPLVALFSSDAYETPLGTRWLTMAEDITERRQSEAAQREAQDRLEKLAERVPGVVFQCRIGPDGVLTLPYASPQLMTLFEFDASDVAVDPSLAFSRYHPDDAPMVAAAVEASARDLTQLAFEVRVVVPSGREKWVAATAMPEREPDGSTTWAGLITDVTARKQAEARLAASELRFQLAMEATSDALFDWNIETGEAFTSPRYVRMLGFEPGEWAPTVPSWQERVHPDDLDRVWKTLEACVSGERERYELEYRLRTKSGEWRWVLSRGKGLERDVAGRAKRLVGTQVDVSEQKRFEQELAQRDRLANLGLLAAGTAHEVNNPLTWMLANLDEVSSTLQRVTELTTRAVDALGADAARALGDGLAHVTPAALEELTANAAAALEGTGRIRQLSRSLGAFARADEAELEAVDVNAALEAALGMAANELRFRARVERSLQPVPAVRAVSGKLTQLFLNLLVHAAQAIPEGHIDEHRITLRSWREDGFVFVELSDAARAMSAEEEARLFEPRFSTAEGDSVGLGLAIARNLVTEFGGDVTVSRGPGLRLVVRLPTG